MIKIQDLFKRTIECRNIYLFISIYCYTCQLLELKCNALVPKLFQNGIFSMALNLFIKFFINHTTCSAEFVIHDKENDEQNLRIPSNLAYFLIALSEQFSIVIMGPGFLTWFQNKFWPHFGLVVRTCRTGCLRLMGIPTKNLRNCV